MDGQAPASAPPSDCVAPSCHLSRAHLRYLEEGHGHGSDELTQERSSLRGLLGRNEEPRRAISESWKYQGCFSSLSLPNYRSPSQLVIRLRPRSLGPRRCSMGSGLAVWGKTGEHNPAATQSWHVYTVELDYRYHP